MNNLNHTRPPVATVSTPAEKSCVPNHDPDCNKAAATSGPIKSPKPATANELPIRGPTTFRVCSE